MKTNLLASEKSPYLLQHKHNPVEWHPWGEAAFEKARTEQKPIFLSIGYSTCHWCHVMEHESFENEETAALLNKHFVSIKVDREERPDVDRIYMTYVQASTGSGGWPMSVFLTPALEPFFGGTYFPPIDRWGKAGFPTIIQRLGELWRDDRPRLLAHSQAATEALRESQAAQPVEPPDASHDEESDGGSASRLHPHLLDGGYEQIARTFDAEYGGFSHAPKFPRPVTIDFLLRYSARPLPSPGGAGNSAPQLQPQANTNTQRHARDMAAATLDAMARGGLYDHLGGGFHRYSVDRFWHISHFEKMLYDQAQLVMAYTDAYQLTSSPLYAATIRGTLDYILHDMTNPEGAFFSAEDADSLPSWGAKEKIEGAFYVWEESEIRGFLSSPLPTPSSMTDGDLFCLYYGVELNGNAPEGSDPHGEFTNKNALIQRTTAEALSTETGLSVDVIESSLAKSRATLLAIRNERPRPHLDDKILTAWNGLTISAFARAGRALSEPAYVEVAARAATFIKKELWDGVTLLRSYREGPSDIHAFADDYAYLTQGLLDLYEATGQQSWLEWADALRRQGDARFLDTEHGGYFSTERDAPNLLFRVKEDYDGAEPSPNSVFALNLLRFSDIFNSDVYRERAEALLNCFILQLARMPSAVPLMLSAAERALSSPAQYQLIGKETGSLQETLYHHYIPNKSILHIPNEAARQWLLPFHPTLEHLDIAALSPSILICENQMCLPPIRDSEALAEHLQSQQS